MHSTEYSKEAERLLSDARITYPFVLEPNVCMEAFGITSKEEQESYNQRIIDRVKIIEQRELQKRTKLGKRAMGAERLRNAVFNTKKSVPAIRGDRFFSKDVTRGEITSITRLAS